MAKLELEGSELHLSSLFKLDVNRRILTVRMVLNSLFGTWMRDAMKSPSILLTIPNDDYMIGEIEEKRHIKWHLEGVKYNGMEPIEMRCDGSSPEVWITFSFTSSKLLYDLLDPEAVLEL
jgi:hypothetical protein